MSKLNIKLWGKSPNTMPKWIEDRAGVCAFPDNDINSIFVRTHNWVEKNGEFVPEKLEKCMIEINDDKKCFHWVGTWEGLIKTLEKAEMITTKIFIDGAKSEAAKQYWYKQWCDDIINKNIQSNREQE
jgi:hypothetical protein